MNHLIVRQRQNKVFGMVVQHTKGQLVVMILAVHRVQLHVVQRVVHPAQIPLVPEPQAARFRWTRHAREVCRFFRHADRAGHLLANNAVGITQKLNGFQVFTTAELVRYPLALFAAVVTVDHRGHRIDTQRINPKTLHPVQGVTHQIITDFTTTIVVDQRIPVLVIALARVAVLIEVGAVKLR